MLNASSSERDETFKVRFDLFKILGKPPGSIESNCFIYRHSFRVHVEEDRLEVEDIALVDLP